MMIKRYALVWCLLVVASAFDFGGFIDSATSGIKDVANDVGSTTTSLADSAKKLITDTTQQLTNRANAVIDSTTTNLNNLKNSTINEVNNQVNNLQTLTLKVKNDVQTFSTNTIEDIKRKSEELGNTISQNVNLAIETVKKKAEELINTINNFSDAMCEEQCTAFYNLPCFLLFRCTQKIKKFFLVLVLPIIIVMILVCGCSSGLLSPLCLCKVLKIVTCISLIQCILEAKKEKETQQKNQKQQDQERKPKEIQQKKHETQDQPQKQQKAMLDDNNFHKKNGCNIQMSVNPTQQANNPIMNEIILQNEQINLESDRRF